MEFQENWQALIIDEEHCLVLAGDSLQRHMTMVSSLTCMTSAATNRHEVHFVLWQLDDATRCAIVLEKCIILVCHRIKDLPLYLYSIIFHLFGRSAFCFSANVCSKLSRADRIFCASLSGIGKLSVVSPKCKLKNCAFSAAS